MSVQSRLELIIKREVGLELKVAKQIRNTWRKFRQIRPEQEEACGILIGGYDQSVGEIFLESCTTPKAGDVRERSYFKLQDPFHQRAVDRAHKRSQGEQFYLGTWHSHPERNPSPSIRDWLDWKKCMKRNPETDFFIFAIVGTESVSIYPYERGR